LRPKQGLAWERVLSTATTLYFWGKLAFSMKRSGNTSVVKNRNSEKVDRFLTLIHGWVQEEKLFFAKSFS
jgi:hypothetical protein